MRKSILVLSLLLFAGSVFAQKRTLEFNKHYSKAKIYRPGIGTMPVSDMVLINDTLIQFSSRTGNGSLVTKQLSASNVKYVKVRKGSYVGVGAFAGAGIGLLSSIYGIAMVKSDETIDDTGFNYTPVVIGFTAVGALVGTIVGLCIPKWKTYFVPSTKTSYSIKFSPAVSPAYCGLGLKMKF